MPSRSIPAIGNEILRQGFGFLGYSTAFLFKNSDQAFTPLSTLPATTIITGYDAGQVFDSALPGLEIDTGAGTITITRGGGLVCLSTTTIHIDNLTNVTFFAQVDINGNQAFALPGAPVVSAGISQYVINGGFGPANLGDVYSVSCGSDAGGNATIKGLIWSLTLLRLPA